MSRSGDGGRGGPPRLQLRLLRKLKILAIANAMPLLAVAFVGYNLATGQMAIRDDIDGGLVVVLVFVMLGCCALIGISSWFVMPLVRWLRDYPAWHATHGAGAVWYLPAACGWLVWAATWVAMALCAIASVTLIVVAGWLLAVEAGLVEAAPAESGESAETSAA